MVLDLKEFIIYERISHIHQNKSPFHSKISTVMVVGTKCFKGINEEMSIGVVL